MTTARVSPSSLQPVVAQRRRNGYLVLLLISAAGALALLVIGEQRGPPIVSIGCALALLPITIAAYHRRGWQITLAVVAFFSTAYLPIALHGGTPLGQAVVAWVFYTLALIFFAFLANMLAKFVRTRSALTGAVRDWESLVSRASSLDEVACFILQEATGLTGAATATLLLRNPAHEEWDVLALEANRLQRSPLAVTGATLSLAGWLIQQSASQILNDLDGDPRFVDVSQTGLRSLLSQPLRQPNGQSLAVLVLGNKQGGGFEQADLEALRDLTSAAEQALDQAGAVARTDDILAQRMHQLGALQRSARELNASLDPHKIVNKTLGFALDICNGQAGLVVADLPGLGLITRVQNGSLTDQQVSQVVARVSRLALPQIERGADTSWPSLLPEASMRLSVPLRRRNRTLGVIWVEVVQPHASAEEVLGTLASLADHAVVALDNARLFGEILREKRKSDQIVRNIADAVFTVDGKGQITSFNPAACALTGWRAEEAFGHRVCDVLGCCADGEDAARCALLTALHQRTQVLDERWTIHQRLGSQRVVTLSGAPLEPRDGSGGLVVLLHDVTEQRKMEQFQQELIASFSHELRTPLASIGVITQMLLADNGALHDHREDTREHLLLLQAQSQRLEGFAERFLALAQTEEDVLALEPQPLASNLLAQSVVQQWQTIHPGRTFHVSAPTYPVWAWADEQAVSTVLEALLDNACKYTPCVTPIEVRVTLDTPDWVTIAVCDQGPGLAAEDQARIFDRFYRVDNSDARTVYGHGFGLYIARQLVEAMAGQIWVESNPGAGSRFAFTLPPMPWEEADEDRGG